MSLSLQHLNIILLSTENENKVLDNPNLSSKWEICIRHLNVLWFCVFTYICMHVYILMFMCVHLLVTAKCFKHQHGNSVSLIMIPAGGQLHMCKYVIWFWSSFWVSGNRCWWKAAVMSERISLDGTMLSTALSVLESRAERFVSRFLH